MQANTVVYQIRRGRDGLPELVRLQTQKRPGAGRTPGRIRSSHSRANRKEVKLVNEHLHYTTTDPR
jgi:hypothetical protein